MKLLNYTTSYFAGILLVIISIWAFVFYYAMLEEIYDSIDDGLDNRKGLIIQRAAGDSMVLDKRSFGETDYTVQELTSTDVMQYRDQYFDTSMYMQNEDDFEPVRLLRTVFLLKGRYYQLQVATSMVEEDDLVKKLLYAIIWLYLGLVVTILVLNNFLLRRIWRPFYQLIKGLKMFRLEKPVPVAATSTNVEEFQLLNDSIQRLLKSNVDAYTSQKHFIENASHELQTPLAIAINKLESLAEHRDLPDDQLKLVAAALDNLERLTRLNKSLLLLSKIEANQFQQVENVNINALARKIIDDFSDQLAFSQLSLTIEEEGTCIHSMNPDLAAVLITNLIKNAIVHNHQHGSIHIIITPRSLTISNTGEEHSIDRHTLFDRFKTTNMSENSSGLGLSIVKAIADLYKCSVNYVFSGEHTITVTFPGKN